MLTFIIHWIICWFQICLSEGLAGQVLVALCLLASNFSALVKPENLRPLRNTFGN